MTLVNMLDRPLDSDSAEAYHVMHALQAWGFDDERLSVLFGLVKEVHNASVKQRVTVERSFAFFKDTLLNHSVHRCACLNSRVQHH